MEEDKNIDKSEESKEVLNQNSTEASLEGPFEKMDDQDVVDELPAFKGNPVTELTEKVKEELGKVLVGQEEVIELCLVALFTKSHVLIEGVPGIAKTLASKILAKSIDTGYSRIQFTPDLMPADILGASVFNMKTSEFSFKSGPIFSNIILIDEINRAPAKTQAALFEVMEERQATIEGIRYSFEEPFFVIATQNPIEQEGTYKLPEAQLDRFIFKIQMKYPTLEEEVVILERFNDDIFQKSIETVRPVVNNLDLELCQKTVETISVSKEILVYIANLVEHTRISGDLHLGASPRASLALMKASKAIAAMNGRDFVTPEDVQHVLIPIMNHRIVLSAEREMEGYEADDILDEIVKKVEVPR